jgi:hypothetical protein
MLQIGMKWGHIKQVAIRRVPNSMMHRDQIARARDGANQSMMEHPTELHPSSMVLSLPFGIFKTFCRLSPNSRPISRKAKRLAADCLSKCCYVRSELRFCWLFSHAHPTNLEIAAALTLRDS